MNPLNFLIKPTTVYQFAQMLQMPYTDFEAYRTKVINENGRIINPNGSMDGLEYITIRLRSMFKELMPGSTQYFLKNLSGTVKLFSEEFSQMGLDISDVNVVLENYLLETYEGKVSYLDYLLEQAQVRYITEEMTSGGSGLAGPNAETKQGGVSGYDRPAAPPLTGKKKKKLKELVVEAKKAKDQPVNPYMPLQVDPMVYDELTRSRTPSGALDPEQLTDAGMKKYFTRLAQRSKNKVVFVVGNQNQPPVQLTFQSDKNT